MKALLIVAHGSRRQESNAEILTMGSRLQDTAAKHFGAVRTAFLQFGAPSIPSQMNV